MGAVRILLFGVLVACGGKSSSSPARPAPTDDADANISLVTSAVMMDACPDAKKLDSKQARREIDELVGPCKQVHGGAAHFSATLLPGGAVELASPEGNPDDGVVPTCVLQQQKQLRHRLRLTKPCKFDVKLDSRS